MMGIDANGAAFLIAAKKAGVSFSQTVTIGRQSIHFGPGSLRLSFKQAGIDIPAAEQQSIFKADGYCELLFEKLGADFVESVDNSKYEGVTYAADLNQPIPKYLKKKYSILIDGGTTEHVFNYPQAIKNCMEMISIGGHYIGILPTNNLCGHGFYQFSPELYYRVFSPENGFEVERIYIAEVLAGAKWMKVPDPALVKSRVEYSGHRGAYIYVRARRTADVPIFAQFPQQSDYVEYWAADDGDDKRRPASYTKLKSMAANLPAPFKRALASTISLGRSKTSLLTAVDLFSD